MTKTKTTNKTTMKHRAPLSLLALAAAPAALGLTACGGGGGECTGTIIAREANNYAFTSKLVLPPVSIKPRPTDLTFDWSGVTKDFLGHDVDPKAGIDMIEVLVVKLSLADLQDALSRDGTLPTSDLVVVPPPTFITDGTATSAPFTMFAINGVTKVPSMDIEHYMDPAAFPPASNSYLAIAAMGTELGKGSLIMQAFTIDPASTNTTINLTSTSTKLEYTADLHTAKATNVPAGQAAVTADWGMMKKNALGTDFTHTAITSALVAHYSQTPTYLETHFLDLEILPTEIYRTMIDSGTVVDFSTMKTTSGQTFGGIGSEGTWLLGLQCGNCGVPAPWYLTVLKPCSP